MDPTKQSFASLKSKAELPGGDSSPGDRLLGAFTDVRDELVSTLWYVLGNKEDAQDVAQEAFLKCWKKQHDISKVENIKAWIFRVALNTGKDLQRSAYRRKSRALPAEDLMEAKPAPSPYEQVQDNESVELVRKALMDLRPEEKEVFLLRQNAEMTYEEIALSSHRPVGTVKTQMRSALQKLKKALA